MLRTRTPCSARAARSCGGVLAREGDECRRAARRDLAPVLGEHLHESCGERTGALVHRRPSPRPPGSPPPQARTRPSRRSARGRRSAGRRRAASPPGPRSARPGCRSRAAVTARRSRSAALTYSDPDAVGAAHPLLPGAGVGVAAERAHVDLDRAEALRAVEQHGHVQGSASSAGASRPLTQPTCEQATSRRLGTDGVWRRSPNGTSRTLTTPLSSRAAPSAPSRPGCSSSLVTISSPGLSSRPGDHLGHAFGRAGRQRKVGRLAAERAA